MATPSISNIYPSSAHTGGEALIRILGGGFKAPPDPLTETVTGGALQQTVQVLFGTRPAEYVAVVNDALMYVRAPISPLSDAVTGAGTGLVSITVKNLDSVGVAIPGETVTAANAFTYRDVLLSTESDLLRVVRTLLVEMRRQIIPEVVSVPHSDYDDDTTDGENIVAFAKLPSIALIGPQLPENRFNRPRGQDYVAPDVTSAAGYSTSVRKREPHTVDLKFKILGAASKLTQLINLQAATTLFIKQNCFLSVLRDPATPSLGSVQFELRFDRQGGLDIESTRNDSNVLTFTSNIILIGVPIEALAGFGGTSSGAVDITGTVSSDPDAIMVESEAIVD